MAPEQAKAWVAEAHSRLGVRGGALVLFGPDAAFPHGTTKPRKLQAGDVVLVDHRLTPAVPKHAGRPRV